MRYLIFVLILLFSCNKPKINNDCYIQYYDKWDVLFCKNSDGDYIVKDAKVNKNR
jgi:hypothetical protein